MRICSLLPSATEILYALGLGEELVGVSHECDWPPEARTKPQVTRTVIEQETWSSEQIDRAVRAAIERHESLYWVDHEALARARPDIIVTQALCKVCAIDSTQVTEVLRSLSEQPRVIWLHPHTLSELFEEVQAIGHATNRPGQAAELVTACIRRIERVKSVVAEAASRPRVFCLEWISPPMATGHWVPEMVELAGGIEVLGRAGGPSRYVTWEEIAEAAPEVLILMPCGFPIERTRRELPLLTGQSWWRKLPAVRDHRVYLVNGPAYFNRAGPRLIDGIELLAGLLHPGQGVVRVPGGSAVAGL